jgi:ABC-type branched-subunit amino acid transport system substrate-binding protein
MYREGLLPSGEPMRAMVSEDIEVDGSMFSCQSCHLRSGRGSLESTVITLPTCASWLYKPLVGREMRPESEARLPDRLNPPPFREAYTDRLVGRAIWVGKDPNDRELSWVMPRYKLSTRDMEILVYYLKHLSAEFSPGVDDTTLRFATVVAGEVNRTDRDAMVLTLQAIVRDRNSQTRHEERRAQHGPFNMEELYNPYRRYSLAVWELQGDPSTWDAQLEDHYNEAPVFALLGGITSGEWAPIHDFCERRQIPALLPITDFPKLSDTDWYTVYFSKSYFQEGETAARFLERFEAVVKDAPVVQVRRDRRAGRDAAAGFNAARSSRGLKAPTELVVEPDRPIDKEFWERLVASHPGAVLALWLEPADVGDLATLAAVEPRPPAVVLSLSLLEDQGDVLPAQVRPFAYLTYPYSLPEDVGRSRLAVESWLRAKGLPVTNFRIQTKTYFLGWMLAASVKRMRDDFYRDYFLDVMDMMRDEYYSIGAVYPRLSFGPGQRYASKGCYVVQLGDGDPPALVKRSDWVIH